MSLARECSPCAGSISARPTKTRPIRSQAVQSVPSLFRSRLFWGYSLCMAFSMGGLYAFLAAAPLVATAVFRMSPATLGFYMGSTAAGFIWQFCLGAICSALSTHNDGRCPQGSRLCRIDGWPRFATRRNRAEVALFGACVFLGVGNGVSMPSSNVGAMSVRPELVGSAAGLSGALTGAGRVLSRDHQHRPKRGQRSIRPARDDACFVDNGVAGSVVRALARPT